jgi:single-strand DNA-binding protein
MDLNSTVLWGRLTREPEVRTGASGVTVANFTLASNYRYNDKAGQQKAETAYLDCVVLGPPAEWVREHHCGEPVLVSGRLRTVQYEQQGRKCYKLELVVNTITFPQRSGNAPQPGMAMAETEKAVPF